MFVFAGENMVPERALFRWCHIPGQSDMFNLLHHSTTMQTRSLVFLALAAAASAFTAPAMGGRMQLRSSKAGENALRLPCGLAAACRPHRCRCALRRRPRPGGAAGRRAARRCSLRQGGRSFPENVLSYCRAGSRAWTRSLSSDPTPTLPQGIGVVGDSHTHR